MTGIYNELLSLLMNYIYGVADVSALTSDQSLTLTLLATAGSIFLVAIPFIIVWQVIKLFR